ncbi:methylglyoxal synthase [Bacteriovorax sp. BSW11_IV]|uniref:methylglyoxal synthase n=1 Tax=Bacteriovorax sp. BSW11_IV TaxID=1353529 RepID=UPI00038A358A|nr:methylglyoxal synthase [Bacteriovorax sp. BSW11_IV]EQC49468.1 methylglyoxal synthase [Bacteriovorax sp. BSW11_IV]
MSTMKIQKKIALVAHDKRKDDLIKWIEKHKDILKEHQLFATGTTGVKIENATGLKVKRYKSGPIGGDQQIGAAIVDEGLDVLVFFWDPLTSQAHDPDVKALLRVATLWNAVLACNKSTADFIIRSPLLNEAYKKDLSHVLDYTADRQVI